MGLEDDNLVLLDLRAGDIHKELLGNFGSWMIYMIRLAEKRMRKQEDELLRDWCNGKSAPTNEERLMYVPTGEASEFPIETFGASGNRETVVISRGRLDGR